MNGPYLIKFNASKTLTAMEPVSSQVYGTHKTVILPLTG
jgi:hypothetical protein